MAPSVSYQPAKTRPGTDPIVFNVGPFRYSVVWVDGMIDVEGVTYHCYADYFHFKLLISTGLPALRQFGAILHELRHAWAHHFPKPSNHEDECENFSTMVISLVKDLWGEDALLVVNSSRDEDPRVVLKSELNGENGTPLPATLARALEEGPAKLDPRVVPLSSVDEVEYQGLPSKEVIECPCCERKFSGKQVENGKPDWNEYWHCLTMKRRMVCDHCDDRVIEWEQTCNAAGEPIGKPLAEPTYIYDTAEVEKFRAANPGARGTY